MEWKQSVNGGASFETTYGWTASGKYYAGSNGSSNIYLNSVMLNKSSLLLIAAVTIHESIHGLINANIVNAGYSIDDGNSWMIGINSWILINGLPSNFTNHYEMMTYYFDNTLSILTKMDNNSHSQKDYAMAMLVGLNNPGTDDGTQKFQTDKAILVKQYSDLLTKYSISAADMDAFLSANMEAQPSAQLPKNGCN